MSEQVFALTFKGGNCRDEVVNFGATAATGTITVPADKLWIVQSLSLKQGDSTSRTCSIQVVNAASHIVFRNVGAAVQAQNTYFICPKSGISVSAEEMGPDASIGPLIFLAGDVISFIVTSGATGADVYFGIARIREIDKP